MIGVNRHLSPNKDVICPRAYQLKGATWFSFVLVFVSSKKPSGDTYASVPAINLKKCINTRTLSSTVYTSLEGTEHYY